MSQLRIATFNLLHGQPLALDGSPVPFPPDPAAPLSEAIAALDPDVLAMQEVDRYQERSGFTDQTAIAAKAMGATDWRFAAAMHGRPAPVSGWLDDPSVQGFQVYGPDQLDAAHELPAYGTALLTRLPVRHWRARRFAPAPFGLPLRVAGRRWLTQVPDEPRAALAAVLVGEHGPFTVVATHLSFVPGWNMAQLAALRRWIADLPRPYLLLGDFNLVGAVPRTVLGGASAVEGMTRTARRGRRVPAGTVKVRGSRRTVRDLREARQARIARQEPRRRRLGRPRPAPLGPGPVGLGEPKLRGWRDLARTPTYPSHRPAVQFDHVLAVGVSRKAVGAALTPRVAMSDHRPLLVEVDL